MAEEKIKVVCGANQQEFDNLEGKTVSEVRQALADVLNIPADAQAIISGDNVEVTYQLRPGDVLEFIKKSGEKGQ